MGNPDADILLVGTEKALDPKNFKHYDILNHELNLNVEHWEDIIVNHNHLIEHLDPLLLIRSGLLNGFNPFNPLLFPATLSLVGGRAGHTYYGLQRLLNYYEGIRHLPVTTIFERLKYNKCTFSRCFLTEVSANPARNIHIAKFNLSDFFVGLRYHFMTTSARDFYTSFKNVVIYAGKNNRYVGAEGTTNRLKIIRIFNPSLNHLDIINMPHFDYYDNGHGARVILCRHLAAGLGNGIAIEIANSIF